MERLNDKIEFRDENARTWLIRKQSEIQLATSSRVDLSTIARRVFAIGRVMVERYPEMLDLPANAGLPTELDEAIRPYLGIPSVAQLEACLQEGRQAQRAEQEEPDGLQP